MESEETLRKQLQVLRAKEEEHEIHRMKHEVEKEELLKRLSAVGEVHAQFPISAPTSPVIMQGLSTPYPDSIPGATPSKTENNHPNQTPTSKKHRHHLPAGSPVGASMVAKHSDIFMLRVRTCL
jgi:hypothetical protein